MFFRKNFRKILILLMLSTAPVVQANGFVDFFKAIGQSITRSFERLAKIINAKDDALDEALDQKMSAQKTKVIAVEDAKSAAIEREAQRIKDTTAQRNQAFDETTESRENSLREQGKAIEERLNARTLDDAERINLETEQLRIQTEIKVLQQQRSVQEQTKTQEKAEAEKKVFENNAENRAQSAEKLAQAKEDIKISEEGLQTALKKTKASVIKRIDAQVTRTAILRDLETKKITEKTEANVRAVEANYEKRKAALDLLANTNEELWNAKETTASEKKQLLLKKEELKQRYLALETKALELQKAYTEQDIDTQSKLVDEVRNQTEIKGLESTQKTKQANATAKQELARKQAIFEAKGILSSERARASQIALQIKAQSRKEANDKTVENTKEIIEKPTERLSEVEGRIINLQLEQEATKKAIKAAELRLKHAKTKLTLLAEEAEADLIESEEYERQKLELENERVKAEIEISKTNTEGLLLKVEREDQQRIFKELSEDLLKSGYSAPDLKRTRSRLDDIELKGVDFKAPSKTSSPSIKKLKVK